MEEGWECTKTSPSVCTHRGSAAPAKPHDSPDAPSGGGGGAPPPPHKKGHSGWGAALLVLAVTAAVVGGMYVGRERIYDHFPQASNHCSRWVVGQSGRGQAAACMSEHAPLAFRGCVLMTAHTCLPLQVESVVDAVASRLPGHHHRYTFAGG